MYNRAAGMYENMRTGLLHFLAYQLILLPRPYKPPETLAVLMPLAEFQLCMAIEIVCNSKNMESFSPHQYHYVPFDATIL